MQCLFSKNIQKADAIGKEGFYTGRREFDYRAMGEKCIISLLILINRKYDRLICVL